MQEVRLGPLHQEKEQQEMRQVREQTMSLYTKSYKILCIPGVRTWDPIYILWRQEHPHPPLLINKVVTTMKKPFKYPQYYHERAGRIQRQWR